MDGTTKKPAREGESGGEADRADRAGCTDSKRGEPAGRKTANRCGRCHGCAGKCANVQKAGKNPGKRSPHHGTAHRPGGEQGDTQEIRTKTERKQRAQTGASNWKGAHPNMGREQKSTKTREDAGAPAQPRQEKPSARTRRCRLEKKGRECRRRGNDRARDEHRTTPRRWQRGRPRG